MSPFVAAFVALTLASTADAVTTRLGLARGLVEANPLMRWSTRNLAWALVTKALALIVIAVSLGLLADSAPSTAIVVVLGATAWNLALALRNYRLWAFQRVRR